MQPNYLLVVNLHNAVLAFDLGNDLGDKGAPRIREVRDIAKREIGRLHCINIIFTYQALLELVIINMYKCCLYLTFRSSDLFLRPLVSHVLWPLWPVRPGAGKKTVSLYFLQFIQPVSFVISWSQKQNKTSARNRLSKS